MESGSGNGIRPAEPVCPTRWMLLLDSLYNSPSHIREDGDVHWRKVARYCGAGLTAALERPGPRREVIRLFQTLSPC